MRRADTRFGRRRPRSRGSSSGQSLTELALALPALLLILLLVIDFARLFGGWVELQNMARIAANYAANHPDAWSASNPDPTA